MEHHNKSYKPIFQIKSMNRLIRTLGMPLLSIPFFISPLYSETQNQTVQTFSQPRLEEKAKNLPLGSTYENNSLISSIGQKLNPEEFPNFYMNIDKKSLRLRIFQKRNEEGILLLESPVALGRKGWETPLGNFYLRRIINLPVWYPPAWAKTNKVPKPGKNNPYGLWMSELSTQNEKGTHDFSVSGDSMIRVHSTDEPSSIGKYVSHGCIRLPPKFAEELFPALLHYISHGEPRKNARGIIYPLEKAILLSIE